MIVECPECSSREQVTRNGRDDWAEFVCDNCGKIYRESLIRMEERESEMVNNK